MNRIAAAIAAPFTAAGSTVRTITNTILFARGRGWGVLLSRSRIDYRSEIGDPATNSIVGAVVGWIARNFPEAPVRIVREGTMESAYTPGATGPGFMLRLLERPNPYYSGPLQWMATLVDWYCRGDAYWFKERAPGGRVMRLWWLPYRTVEPRWPESDPTVFISHYDYTIDGLVYRLRPEDVVHFRNGIDPYNTRKGQARLAPLYREIFTDDEAANFTASLMRNLGVPGVVLAPSNTTGSGGIGRTDPEAVKRSFMEKFGGDKRGEPLVLTAPTDVKVLSFNPQEMDLKALRRIPEERISANLGVPAGVAQLGAGLDRNTFTNYGEANVAAYTQGVIPSHRLFAADLEIQLLPEFVDIDREALDVWFDWTKTSAMQSAAAAVWRQLESSATKGLITRAAFKRGTGQKVEDGDEIYLLPNNYAMVEAGGNSPGPALLPGPSRAAIAGGDGAPGVTVIPAAAEVRCQGCDKLLAEKAAVPYRMTCPRCKVVAEAA